MADEWAEYMRGGDLALPEWAVAELTSIHERLGSGQLEITVSKGRQSETIGDCRRRRNYVVVMTDEYRELNGTYADYAELQSRLHQLQKCSECSRVHPTSSSTRCSVGFQPPSKWHNVELCPKMGEVYRNFGGICIIDHIGTITFD